VIAVYLEELLSMLLRTGIRVTTGLYGDNRRARDFLYPVSPLSFETENRTTDFIFKTSNHVRSTMMNTNVSAAFRGIGLSLHDIGDVQRVLFDEITLRESRRFQEL
jgi:hypothetical protein